MGRYTLSALPANSGASLDTLVQVNEIQDVNLFIQGQCYSLSQRPKKQPLITEQNNTHTVRSNNNEV